MRVTRAPLLVRRLDRLLSASSDHSGVKSPWFAVDPVAYQLHPAVTRRACSATKSGSCDSSSMSIAKPGE